VATVAAGADEDLETLEERARPYRALYEHWERTQWAATAIDFSTDAASFAALDDVQQRGMIWIFAHRFHAEFNVATLLAPFIAAAPNYDMQLMLATQIADEHRHLQCVLRIYEEVFGVRGGITAVREVADRTTDPVATLLYPILDRRVRALEHDKREETFLQAVVCYHLLGEGVVARTAQNLAAGQYERLGAFPGLAEGQRFVARDEARHIGLGVTYARRRIEEAPDASRALIDEVINECVSAATEGLAMARANLEEVVRDGYGVDAESFYNEAARLLDVRLRSIGYYDE
jgi:ribonucleotide reductase beta subunit family protein with ferritin-like domain